MPERPNGTDAARSITESPRAGPQTIGRLRVVWLGGRPMPPRSRLRHGGIDPIHRSGECRPAACVAPRRPPPPGTAATTITWRNRRVPVARSARIASSAAKQPTLSSSDRPVTRPSRALQPRSSRSQVTCWPGSIPIRRASLFDDAPTSMKRASTGSTTVSEVPALAKGDVPGLVPTTPVRGPCGRADEQALSVRQVGRNRPPQRSGGSRCPR